MKHGQRLALLLIALLALSSPSRAQDDNYDRSRMGAAAYYNYADPGELTVTVQILGTVRFPGVYEVALGTRFSEVLALSGGPIMNERLRRNTRTVTVQLYRLRAGERVLFRETRATKGLDVSGGDPDMMAGDIVVVETVVRQGISWRDVFPVVGALASVTLIVERFTRQ